MKRKELARVLRAVVRLMENDLHELSDSVAGIDDRTAEYRVLNEKRYDLLIERHFEHGRRIDSLEGSELEDSIAAIHGRLHRLEERLEELSNATLEVASAHARRIAALEPTPAGDHSRKV